MAAGPRAIRQKASARSWRYEKLAAGLSERCDGWFGAAWGASSGVVRAGSRSCALIQSKKLPLGFQDFWIAALSSYERTVAEGGAAAAIRSLDFFGVTE